MSHEPPPKSPRGGCLRIFLGLLLAPSAISALALIVKLIADGLPAGLGAEERLWLRVALGAILLIFGGGAVALIVSGARALQRGLTLPARLKAAHPDEPWLWRPDWASGRIAGDGAPIAFTVFAALWNAFAWWVAALQFRRVFPEWKRDPVTTLIVPALLVAVGLLLAAAAGRRLGAWLRFRRVSLRLETLPGIIGGRFRGAVEAAGTLPAEAEIVVGISCTRVTQTGGGKRRRDLRELIWQEERPARNVSHLAGELSIPFEISIPPGLPESSVVPLPPHHVWKLHARARIAGPDLETEFEIPVFSAGVRRDTSPETPPRRVEGS